MGNIPITHCVRAAPVMPVVTQAPSTTRPTPTIQPPASATPTTAEPPSVMRAINEGRDDNFTPSKATGWNLYGCCVMYFIEHAIMVPNRGRSIKADLGWNWLKFHKDDDPDVEELINRSLKPHKVHPDEFWTACEFMDKFERYGIHSRVTEAPPLHLTDVPYPYNVDLTVVIHAARKIWDSKTEEERVKDRNK